MRSRTSIGCTIYCNDIYILSVIYICSGRSPRALHSHRSTSSTSVTGVTLLSLKGLKPSFLRATHIAVFNSDLVSRLTILTSRTLLTLSTICTLSSYQNPLSGISSELCTGGMSLSAGVGLSTIGYQVDVSIIVYVFRSSSPGSLHTNGNTLDTLHTLFTLDTSRTGHIRYELVCSLTLYVELCIVLILNVVGDDNECTFGKTIGGKATVHCLNGLIDLGDGEAITLGTLRTNTTGFTLSTLDITNLGPGALFICNPEQIPGSGIQIEITLNTSRIVGFRIRGTNVPLVSTFSTRCTCDRNITISKCLNQGFLIVLNIDGIYQKEIAIILLLNFINQINSHFGFCLLSLLFYIYCRLSEPSLYTAVYRVILFISARICVGDVL